MNTKPKRPALLDLNSLIVKAPAATELIAAAPAVAEIPPPPPSEPETKPAPTKRAATPEPQMFRTSVYFSRAVHDKLREIAFEERKSVTDLINEGLDHVLAARNYATTGELKKKKR